MRRFALPDTGTPESAPADPTEASPVRTLLDLPSQHRAALRVGHVRLAPGQRVPAEGTSRHAVEEVSLIVAGSLEGTSGDETFVVEAGEVTWIPAGENHVAVAGSEGAEIFWVWFGDVASEDAAGAADADSGAAADTTRS